MLKSFENKKVIRPQIYADGFIAFFIEGYLKFRIVCSFTNLL